MKIASNARVKKRVLAAAVATAGSLTLAACTGDAPVAPATTVTQTSSTTTTTSTTPPTTSTPPTSTAPSTSTNATDPVLAKIPEAARPKTKAGASAFAEFYFSQLSLGYQHADPSSLDGLFTSTCGTCKNMQNGMKEFARLGQRYDAPSIVIDSSEVVVFNESQTRVNVKAHQPVVQLVKNSGEVIRKTKPQRGTFVALLSFNGHWRIHTLGAI